MASNDNEAHAKLGLPSQTVARHGFYSTRFDLPAKDRPKLSFAYTPDCRKRGEAIFLAGVKRILEMGEALHQDARIQSEMVAEEGREFFVTRCPSFPFPLILDS